MVRPVTSLWPGVPSGGLSGQHALAPPRATVRSRASLYALGGGRQMRRPKMVLAAAMVAVILVTLLGCGSGGKDEPAPTPSASSVVVCKRTELFKRSVVATVVAP